MPCSEECSRSSFLFSDADPVTLYGPENSRSTCGNVSYIIWRYICCLFLLIVMLRSPFDPL